MDYLALVITLSTGLIFALVWWMLRREAAAGWQPLATAFPMRERPTGPQIRLAWASLGGSGIVGHKSMVVANVSPTGLTLQMPLLAWLCYPAMQIPWSACGLFHLQKRLFLQAHCTAFVRLPDGGSIPVRIRDADFVRAAQPWVTVEEVQ